MVYSSVIREIEVYITDILASEGNGFFYHNLNHTLKVVSHVEEIANYYQLSESDKFVVMAAGWFHDIGYLSGLPSGHEQRGSELLSEFLKPYGISHQIVTASQNCILATILPQKPATLLEEIVCDADLYHFGTDELFFQDQLMQKEVEFRIGQCIEERVWLKGIIHLLEAHEFHTRYCQELLVESKISNLKRFYSMLSKVEQME